MIDWILSSSLLILAVMGVRAVVKEKISQRLRYALWALVLVRLLIPMSFGHSAISTANLSVTIQNQRIATAQETMPPVRTDLEPEHEVNAPLDSDRLASLEETEPAEKEVSRREWFPGIAKILWILGTLLAGAVFLCTNLVFGVRLKKSSRRIRGIGKGLPIRISEEADSPCLFGLFRPTIYVTPEVAENPTLLRHCVCHERCHYRHGDPIWAVLRGICVALHWYNPLVWWAAFLSRQDSELACDEAAIAMLGERERAEYGRTLILMTAPRQLGNVLLAATTMSAKKSVIRERIRMIAQKPKTAVITLVMLILIGAVMVGCAFTGAKESQQEEKEFPASSADSSGTAETATVAPEETVSADTVTLQSQRDREKVCIAVLPTGISTAGDDYRYIIPENQELWLSEYERAISVSSMDGYVWDGGTGMYILYEDDWWEISKSGAMLGVGRVSPEDASALLALCNAEIADAGLLPPVDPENLTGIRSATLNWNGVYTTKNPADLSILESMLTQSVEIRGAGCWFTGLLTLEMENGDVRTIAMATDSCGTWMSEGVCYQYASGNEDFYSIFATIPIHDAVQQGLDNAWDLLPYLDWSRYANQFGEDETYALMDMLKDNALEDPGERCYMLMWMTRGLDGAYADYYGWVLDQVYEADRASFAWSCLGNAPDAVREEVLGLLAYQWGVSTQEARATLRQVIDNT